MAYSKIGRDAARCEYVGDVLKNRYDWVSDVTIPTTENFYIDDTIIHTAKGDYPLEVKGVYGKDVNPSSEYCVNIGDWESANWYKWCESGTTIDQVPEYIGAAIQEELTQNRSGRPQYLNNKKVYILNAECGTHRIEGSKWHKMVSNKKSNLAYLGKDGILLFNHNALINGQREGGFVWLYQKHFKEDNKEMILSDKQNMRWEYKALIDLSYGTFIPCDVPYDLING